MITAAETSTSIGGPSFIVLVVVIIILVLATGAKK